MESHSRGRVVPIPAREGSPRIVPSLFSAARDRAIWAFTIVALLLNLGLFAFLILELAGTPPHLPPMLPLHFDSAGNPDRIEPATSIFSLPQIGLIVIVGNLILGGLIYRRERLAAYLLLASAILIQLLLWFAATAILRLVAF